VRATEGVLLAGKRSARVGEKLLREIAELIEHRVKDPRLRGVTLTGVNMSSDLKYARVYFSVLGEESRPEDALTGFTSARGFIRREIGARMELRYVPDLEFRHDTSLEHGEKMERLLDGLKPGGPEEEES
jgi:ribosome-binding factor A